MSLLSLDQFNASLLNKRISLKNKDLKWISCRYNNPGSHLKDLLTRDLDTAVSRLRLLLGQLLSQDFQFLHQISLVLGHRETFRVLGEISGRDDGLSLLLQWSGTTAEKERGEKRNGVLKRDETFCQHANKHCCLTPSSPWCQSSVALSVPTHRYLSRQHRTKKRASTYIKWGHKFTSQAPTRSWTDIMLNTQSAQNTGHKCLNATALNYRMSNDVAAAWAKTSVLDK